MINILYLLIVVVIYLYLICPKLIHDKNLKSYLNIYYAHRGLHDNERNNVENTLSAFKNAMDLNYGIEFDVRLTKDKIPVIIHDDNLNRVAGIDININEIIYEELTKINLLNSTEHIPSLEEVLELVDSKVPLIIEIKKENTQDMDDLNQIANLLDKYNGKFMIESFNPYVLKWMKNNRPQYIRGQLSSNLIKERGFSLQNFILTYLLLNFVSKPDFIAYDYRFSSNLSLNIVKFIYRSYCVGYTIKSREDFIKYNKYFDTIIFESFLP